MSSSSTNGVGGVGGTTALVSSTSASSSSSSASSTISSATTQLPRGTTTSNSHQNHPNRNIVIGKPGSSSTITKDPATDLALLQQYRTDIMKLFETELMFDLVIVVGPSKLIGTQEDERISSGKSTRESRVIQYNESSEIRLKNKYYPADECSVVEFKVHRAILCARCDYFHKLFHSQMKDSKQMYLKFPDKRPEDMKCLLDFFYSAVININHSNAFGVLKLSDELGVQVVKEKCIEYVKECVMSDNVFDVLEESAFHNFDGRFLKAHLRQ